MASSYDLNVGFISSYHSSPFNMWSDAGVLKRSKTRLWKPSATQQAEVNRVLTETGVTLRDRIQSVPRGEVTAAKKIAQAVILGLGRLAADHQAYPLIQGCAEYQAGLLSDLCTDMDSSARGRLRRLTHPDARPEPLKLLTVGQSHFALDIVRELLSRKYGQEIEAYVTEQSARVHTGAPDKVSRDRLIFMVQLANACRQQVSEVQKDQLEDKLAAHEAEILQLKAQLAQLQAASQKDDDDVIAPPPPPVAQKIASCSSSGSQQQKPPGGLLSAIREGKELKKVSEAEKQEKSKRSSGSMVDVLASAFALKFKNASSQYASESDDDEDTL